jgi:hypothetical protein
MDTRQKPTVRGHNINRRVVGPDPEFWLVRIRIWNNCTKSRSGSDLFDKKIYTSFANFSLKWSNSYLITYIFPKKIF